MKNIKINIFCVMIIATSAYCFANEDDKETQEKTDAPSKNTESKETTNTTLIQNILDTKDDKEAQEQTDQTLDNTELEQRFITRKEVEIVMTAALILFILASIKFEYFPNAEQKRLRALNGPDVGITGMSKSFECLAIILLGRLLR